MNELTGLVIDVEARINKLERGLKQANDRQRKAADEMERRAKQSADRIGDTYGKMSNGIGASFARLGKLALPFAGGLVAGVAAGGVAGIVGNLDRVAEGIANIGNESKRAGVDNTTFQEWAFVADQNRIGIDAMVDALKELHIRAGEFFLDDTGAGAAAFQKLGYSADTLKAKLQDPSNLMTEILGKLGQFDQAGRSFLLEEIFGGAGGEQLSALIGQSETALRDTIARAHEVGAVLDDELIRKAEEIDRKFGEMKPRRRAHRDRVWPGPRLAGGATGCDHSDSARAYWQKPRDGTAGPCSLHGANRPPCRCHRFGGRSSQKTSSSTRRSPRPQIQPSNYNGLRPIFSYGNFCRGRL